MLRKVYDLQIYCMPAFNPLNVILNSLKQASSFIPNLTILLDPHYPALLLSYTMQENFTKIFEVTFTCYVEGEGGI